MLVIDKKTKQSKIIQQTHQITELLQPKLQQPYKCYIFTDWYNMYQEQVDDIIQSYIDRIQNTFSSNDLCHSLNVNTFTEKMKTLLYEKSINKAIHYP